MKIQVGEDIAFKRPLRVLFLNRSYWPDAEATGQLLSELCEDLADQFEITVICGQPNQNPKNEPFCRNGRENHCGVTIERVRHPQWGKKFLPARAANLVGFLFTATVRAFCISRPNIVVVETDPFLLPILGTWLKWRHGSRLVVYLQDLYPDVAVELGKVKEGWLTGFLRWRLKLAYHRANPIVVLSGDMKNRLVKWGLDGSRIVCLENWVDTSAVFPIKQSNLLREKQQLQDRFVVMHSGNMGLSQHLGNVLDASALIQDRTEIAMLMIGDGADRKNLEELAKKLKLNNVRFLPYQPREDLAQSLSAADLHLISMDPQTHHCLMPSKFYGILASGTAVLAVTAQDSELATLIHEHQVGLTVSPGDPHALATSLRWCCDHREELALMGKRARSLAVNQYDRKRQTARFAELALNPPL